MIGGGRWFRHGNRGVFEASTNIRQMQMDNLAFNPDEWILIANELKLGGKKNPDQILKYGLMVKLLKGREFIPGDTRLLLLFIGDKPVCGEWHQLIEEEIEYCRGSGKSTSTQALSDDVIQHVRNSEFRSITWNDIIAFNDRWSDGLDPIAQQVEMEAAGGFNEALRSKAFLHTDDTPRVYQP